MTLRQAQGGAAPSEAHRPDLPLSPALSPDGRGNVAFSGHAALFDRADRVGDVFRRGAFAGAVSVPLLRDHRGAAVGTVSVREDERGLYVEGSAGGVMVGEGLSVGFRPRRVRQGGRREILAAELIEVSLVRVPMQPLARVERVER